MTLLAALAVALGAAVGAVLRWVLGMGFNAMWPTLPAGTLLANWLGAYAIGVLAALFSAHPGVSDTTRLLLMTGLLGGLTTFSTFSLEVVSLMQRQLWWPALTHISLHVLGSIALTLAGMASVNVLRT